MEKKSFLMNVDYEEQLEDLTDEELGILMRAIFRYEKHGTEPKFTGLLKMAFAFIKEDLNRNREKYDKRCETSAINGAKGGRPKREKPNSKPNEKPKKPKKADNEYEDEYDNEDEYDSDNEVEVDIYDFFTSNFGYCIPPIQMQSLEEWLKDFGGNTEIIKFAIKKCCDNNVRTFSYLEGILQAWKSKGFKTIEECKNELRGKKNVENEPEWMDKTIEKKEASAEDKKKIEEMLKEFM